MEEIIHKFKEAFIAMAESPENHMPGQTAFSVYTKNQIIICNWSMVVKHFDMERASKDTKYLDSCIKSIKLYFHKDKVTIGLEEGAVLYNSTQEENHFNTAIETLRDGFYVNKNSFN
ncbi:MAG: hypothetical protein WCO58_00160 [bacterium]